MNTITITRKAHEAEVASIAGIGGYLVQDAVTVITTHTGAEITVVGSRSTMAGVDVSSDAPAGDHEAIVAFWRSQAEGWAASAVRPTEAVVYAGGTVEAPGFTSVTFAAGIEKAVRLGTLHMTPTRRGAVLVMSASSDARYLVTRSSCSCAGHMGHGHCYHRAAAIYVSDIWGVDLCHEAILGFDPQGWPVTAAERSAQLQEAA